LTLLSIVCSNNYFWINTVGIATTDCLIGWCVKNLTKQIVEWKTINVIGLIYTRP